MRTWTEAVTNAVRRLAAKREDGMFTRQELVEGELDSIVADVGSAGLTPAQTLSRELQELRSSGVIEFVDDHGTYRLIR